MCTVNVCENCGHIWPSDSDEKCPMCGAKEIYRGEGLKRGDTLMFPVTGTFPQQSISIGTCPVCGTAFDTVHYDACPTCLPHQESGQCPFIESGQCTFIPNFPGDTNDASVVRIAKDLIPSANYVTCDECGTIYIPDTTFHECPGCQVIKQGEQ